MELTHRFASEIHSVAGKVPSLYLSMTHAGLLVANDLIRRDTFVSEIDIPPISKVQLLRCRSGETPFDIVDGVISNGLELAALPEMLELVRSCGGVPLWDDEARLYSVFAIGWFTRPINGFTYIPYLKVEGTYRVLDLTLFSDSTVLKDNCFVLARWPEVPDESVRPNDQ